MTIVSNYAAVDVGPRAEFRRSEQIVVCLGGAAFGAFAGLVSVLMIGRVDALMLAIAGVPAIIFALHLASRTLAEGIGSGAIGCSAAVVVHAAALLAWPMASLTAPALFWIAPAIALTALAMFASCWNGPPRAIYRMSVQAMLAAALATQQATFMIMGS